jgi:hypothetical protein
MPIVNCTKSGKPGFKWGSENKSCFTYTPGNEASKKRARNKAELQGRAIESNKSRSQSRSNRIIDSIENTLFLAENDKHLMNKTPVNETKKKKDKKKVTKTRRKV